MFNAVNFSDNVEMIVGALRATASRILDYNGYNPSFG